MIWDILGICIILTGVAVYSYHLGHAKAELHFRQEERARLLRENQSKTKL